MRRPIYVIAALLGVLLVALLAKLPDVRPSTGELVYMLDDSRSHECGDGRPVVVTIHPNQNADLNVDTIPDSELIGRLKGIFSTRAELVLFVRADPDASYGRVMEKIGQFHSSVEDLHIAWITNSESQLPCFRIRNAERLFYSNPTPQAPWLKQEGFSGSRMHATPSH